MDNGGMHQYKVYGVDNSPLIIQADGYEVHTNGSVSFWLDLGYGTKAMSVHLPVTAFVMIERVDLSNLFPKVK